MIASAVNIKSAKTHLIPITFTVWRQVAIQNLLKDKLNMTSKQISSLKHEFSLQADKLLLEQYRPMLV
jgi:hypothetical protein